MKIKTNEIAEIIKKQIEDYDQSVKQDDIGTVVTVGDGIAVIYGLDQVMYSELLRFNDTTFGLALSLEENAVGAILFGDETSVKEGDTVTRLKRVIEVPVGEKLLGRVVNALGQPIDSLGEIKTNKSRPIERVAPGVMTRESVNETLVTGIKVIDAIIPIGKGQRELIIGDRQTGKSTIAIDTIMNQKGRNVYCVYVAIGQKNSTVKMVQKTLEEYDAMSYTVIVSATAGEGASMQYIAPYSGMAIAEEWLEEGKDVLIVFDDLSKHAIAYRTVSLLLKRPPGREAYPGDIFYLHSRLLERSCKLKKELGGGSITALPIVETLSGDISAYIPTNIISITDGQIFMKTDLFNAGQRPAVDTGLSVSRIGSAAQSPLMKEASSGLKIELANYHELLSFSQFGFDLDRRTKQILRRGKVLTEILKQPEHTPFTTERQIAELLAVKKGVLDKVLEKSIRPFLDGLYEAIKNNPKIVLPKKLPNQFGKLVDEIDATMREEIIKEIDRHVAKFGKKDKEEAN